MQLATLTTSITRHEVVESLLKHNFLPNQKLDNSDFPPVMTSIGFTEQVAKALATSQDFLERTDQQKQRKKNKAIPLGYDSVRYRLTKFNGAVRTTSILHPAAYANLVLTIADNWKELSYITTNENSKVIPELHSDGRMIIMDYDNKALQSQEAIELSFGKRFTVRADISNCFPSVYSHTIPWALKGMAHAKVNRNRNYWYNKLDKAVQYTKRNETKGIAIGPGTSNIVLEVILAKVDQDLANEFRFTRYVDDYTAYCHTYDKAEQFIVKLTEGLALYELALNSTKTDIVPLPNMHLDSWVVALSDALPKSGSISVDDTMTYLNLMIGVAQDNPDGSALKYGLKSLRSTVVSSLDREVVSCVLQAGLNLSFHQAILVPVLEQLFDKMFTLDGGFRYRDSLHVLLAEHIRLRHSDAVSWLLYYSNKYNVQIKDYHAGDIVSLEDCIPMLLLYLSSDPNHQQRVIDFVSNITQGRIDIYKLDQYWPLLYRLFLDNHIVDPYSQIADLKGLRTSFDILKDEGVDFIASPPALPSLPVMV